MGSLNGALANMEKSPFLLCCQPVVTRSHILRTLKFKQAEISIKFYRCSETKVVLQICGILKELLPQTCFQGLCFWSHKEMKLAVELEAKVTKNLNKVMTYGEAGFGNLTGTIWIWVSTSLSLLPPSWDTHNQWVLWEFNEKGGDGTMLATIINSEYYC